MDGKRAAGAAGAVMEPPHYHEEGSESVRSERKHVPSALAVRLDDLLFIRSVCSVAGVTLNVRVRFLLHNGEIIIHNQPHTPNSNRAAAVQSYTLADGYLLSVVVDVLSGTVRRGQCYVVVGLNRGGLTTLLPVETLVAGYASGTAPLSFPQGGVSSSLDGSGSLSSLQLAAPAAGADFAITVPAGARWRIASLAATLTTAVAVANRLVSIIVDDGSNGFFVATDQSNQAASLVMTYVAAPDGVDRPVQGTAHHLFLPTPLVLFQGWRIRSLTGSIQAADQWSIQNLAVEEWLEP